MIDKCFEPKAGKELGSNESYTTAHRNNFLPLLPELPQQGQIVHISSDASTSSLTLSTSGEKRLDCGTREHARGSNFLPLLPVVSTDYPRQIISTNAPSGGSVAPRSSSGDVLHSKGPSPGLREHVAKATPQKNNGHQSRPRSVRRYEWPLIINGVYQGEGPLPSCRIKDNESPAEPRPCDWPLIVLHQARSVDACDQQPASGSKEANENIPEGEDNADRSKTDGVDGSEKPDGISVVHGEAEN